MNSSTEGYDAPVNPGDISKKEADAGILPSHGITLDVPGQASGRPALIQTLSAPAYKSPIRHHQRKPSQHREIKETLNARSEYTNNDEDGKAEHHINQYIIKDEIGRGSFGAVHLAVDQYGQDFAVKEFSKSRLRKRAQSHILRRPHSMRRPGHLAAGVGFNSPMHRRSASDIHNNEEMGNPLYLIKEEIAIMKKLNHPNLVTLIEVLDDPDEDSLYMVLEMCKKGVIMKVGLGEQADPYDPESCRCWFRDLILGIEYLHAQGVVHRDIKPDNLLLTEDNVLKIVDFGVSEMFEKASEMMTAKSAGSPAFLPPELCVTKHGDISGKAADIWSMGVSLYCLRFGKIPFERSGVLELYEAIRNDQVNFEPDSENDFVDLIQKLLEKDPKQRITMAELREHSWVTKGGEDPLLSAEENCADLVQPPTTMEVNHAITIKMRNLMVMMKAVNKFKNLLEKNKRPNAFSNTLGSGVRTLRRDSTGDSLSAPALHKSRSTDLDDRRHIEQALAIEGVHHDMNPVSPDLPRLDSSVTMIDKSQHVPEHVSRQIAKPRPNPEKAHQHDREGGAQPAAHDKGHARDPLAEEHMYLGIGAGSESLEPPENGMVAESPTAAEFSIYDTAYQQEVERIRNAQGQTAKVYLTRRVDGKMEYKSDVNMVDVPQDSQVQGTHTGFKGVLDKAREKAAEPQRADLVGNTGRTFSDIAAKAVENTKILGKDLSDKGSAALDGLREMVMEKKKGTIEKEWSS